MDSSSSSLQSSIQTLVKSIKEDTLSKLDHNHHDLISPSAYDTAWLAMVPHPHDSSRPLFEECLNWVLNNQNELGCWEEYCCSSGHGGSTIDSLPSALACLIALHKWNVGDQLIHKGLRCMNANIKMLQKSSCQHLPQWLTIVFPAMVELAKSTTTLDLPQELETIVSSILVNREEIVDYKCEYGPLLSYLEAVLPKYQVDEKISLKQEIIDEEEEDGSLTFQSPAATAQAFMLTGNPKYMDYLRSLVLKFPNGVPSVYPIDDEMIKLCIIDHIQRLGLAEYFHKEIGDILLKVYRNYNDEEPNCNEIDFVPAKIYKDSLAFRLLRTQGYKVTSSRFCWFLHDKELKVKMEHDYEGFVSLMYNVYRATDLSFPEEYELEEARSLSKNFLQKALLWRNNIFMSPISNKMIERELSVPWIARLDHMDHRFWIEENKFTPLFIGIGLNDSFHRLQYCHNTKLMQLAVKNYEFRQSIYSKELEELTRWSKEWGLSEMGFGREKTTYCYFSVAASACQLPLRSVVRKLISKSAIIVTVADDFYDMQNGSLLELHALTQAIQRWDGEGLSGHSKTIFRALDSLVTEIAENCEHQDTISNITQIIQDMWRDTFESWMVETSWSINGYLPSIDEYLETGMTSIAAHTMMLPPSFPLNFNQNLRNYKLKPLHLDAITKLLMAMTRILNDTQSYEKEEKEGKMNLVSLIKKTNGDNLQSSVTVIKDIVLDALRKEFLKRVFMDDLPKDFKLLHLSCLKVFQMFFNATNSFDSDTDLIQDINNAFYLPLENPISKPLKTTVPVGRKKNKKTLSVTSCFDQVVFKCHTTRNFSGDILLKKVSGHISGKKVFMLPKISVCFI